MSEKTCETCGITRTAASGQPPTEEQGSGMLDAIRHLIAGY